MKLVPRGQTFRRVEPHPLDPCQEPPQGRGPVSAIGIIIKRLDDQSHTLGLAQPQFLFGLENTVRVDSLYKLSHSVKPSVLRLARSARRIKFQASPLPGGTFRHCYDGPSAP